MAELQTWSREEIARTAARLELVASLSPRETQVIRHLAEGKTVDEIAAAVFVGPSTVKTHLARIYLKLGACNAASAVDRAYRAGILTVEASDG